MFIITLLFNERLDNSIAFVNIVAFQFIQVLALLLFFKETNCHRTVVPFISVSTKIHHLVEITSFAQFILLHSIFHVTFT